MQSSKRIKKGQIEDYISDSTQAAIDAVATSSTDANALHKTGNEVKTSGTLTLNSDLILPNIVQDLSTNVSNLGISTTTNRLVTIPIDESLVIQVTNKTGVTIPKGSVVYINGAQGNKPTIALSLADPNITTSQVLGIVRLDIANNANGYVVINGIATNLNTNAFLDGDTVYLSAVTPGGLTTTVPQSPNHRVLVGTVTRQHSTQGSIAVTIRTAFKLDEISDVAIATPLNNQLLTYETSTGLWKNKAPFFTGTVTNVSALTIGTSGTNISSSVATSTTTPVITLNIPTASALNRGALSNTDWSTFNNKQPQLSGTGFVKATGTTISYDNTTYQPLLTNPVTGTGTTNTLPKFSGTSTLGNSSITDNGTSITLGLNTTLTSGNLTFGSTMITEKIMQLNNSSLSTGLYEFGSGGITMASTTTVNIGNVKGWVVSSADPLDGNPTYVNYAGQSGVTPAFIGVTAATYFLITPGSTLLMIGTRPTVTQRRDNIYLGVVGHPSSTLTGIGNAPDIIMNVMSQVRAMFEPMRFINGGVTVYPNSTDLTVANTSGILYGLGIGFIANGNNAPSIINVAGATPLTFQYRTQGTTTFANTTVADPGFYDVTGTRTAIAGSSNQATNQRFYLLANGAIRTQYGQTVYATLSAAVAGLQSESFVTNVNAANLGILIGVLAITKGCTNLSDTTTAKFLNTGKFGEVAGAAGGASVSTMQNTYNNSATTNPHILTTATNGQVKLRGGTGSNGDPVFEIQNNAGTPTAQVDGDGNHFSTSYIRSVGTANDFMMADGSIKTAITSRGYKSYSVVLDQLGTANPTYTVIGTNDIGTIVWTRSTTGIYLGTLTGAFTANKTFHVLMHQQATADASRIKGIRSSANVYQISTHALSTDLLTDGLLVGAGIEIRVYN